MSQNLEVSAKLINDKVQFTGSTRNNQPIQADYFPPVGDGDGYTGLELLLMSLAVCSSTAIVFLFRQHKKEVKSFAVHASGIRTEELPKAFSKINLKFSMEVPETDNALIEKILKMTETNMCPVWAMIRNNVELEVSFENKG